MSLWYLFTNFNPSIITQLSQNEAILEQELMAYGVIAIGILLIGILVSLGSTYFALNKFIWIKTEKLY